MVDYEKDFSLLPVLLLTFLRMLRNMTKYIIVFDVNKVENTKTCIVYVCLYDSYFRVVIFIFTLQQFRYYICLSPRTSKMKRKTEHKQNTYVYNTTHLWLIYMKIEHKMCIINSSVDEQKMLKNVRNQRW